jgi:endo-1,4-beta-xylanase
MRDCWRRLSVVVLFAITCGETARAGEPPLITLFAETSQTHEAASLARGGVVAVVRDGDLSEPLIVPIQVSGTATNDHDYQFIAPVVEFAAGESIRRIRIVPTDDDLDEGPETVVLSLAPDIFASSGTQPMYRLGPPSRQRVTVTIAGEIPSHSHVRALVLKQSTQLALFEGDAGLRTSVAVNDPDLPFLNADAITVRHAANPWDIALQWSLSPGLAAGDEVLVSLFARVTDAAPGTLTIRLQNDHAPYAGSEKTFAVSEIWQSFLFRATLPDEVRRGPASLSVRVGRQPQQIQIGGLQFWNFGSSPPPHLPQPIYSYAGRQADASWRTNLAKRIEQARCDKVLIPIDDVDLHNASLRLRLVKADYEIGTAINSDYVAATAGDHFATADAQTYREIVTRYFDRVTDENSQQWVMWEQNPQRAIETAAWANQQGLTLRGHSVLWGDPVKWPSPPSLWKEYQATEAARGTQAAMLQMRARVAAHVRNNTLVALAGNIPGTEQPIISEWDVVNHPIVHDEMWEITGWEFLRAAVREARMLANSKTKFFINEDQVLSLPEHPNADPLYRLIESFLAAKLPIDGIGFQSHFHSDRLPAIASIQSVIERFARLGLQLHVTEFDIDDAAIDEQTQADFTRDFLDLLAAHDSVTATTLWGFWEGEHWRSEEGAALYDRNWNLRANGQAFIDHVDRDWKAITLAADNPSQILRRGHYELEITDESGTKRIKKFLAKKPRR